jgi:nucleotidyltransferase substrate binding protein (TIGR01987 family)
MSQIDLSRLKMAVKSFEEALVPPPRNDRERDGAIQRFEFTLELTWKFGKKILEKNGIQSDSPRTVIREMYQAKWIKSSELWFSFLDARNLSSHIYEEATAQEVFGKSKEFLTEVKQLLIKFETLA